MVFALIVVTATCLTLFFSNDLNRAVFDSSGDIERRSEFGVEIGEARSAVREYLKSRGLVDMTRLGAIETHYDPLSCHGKVYDEKYSVEIWADDDGRRLRSVASTRYGSIAALSGIQRF